jgi:hypothetical protein
MEEENEYEVNIAELPVAKLMKLTQEGNYLIGVTDNGVKFSQRIPQGKILDKVNDKWVLRDIVTSS